MEQNTFITNLTARKIAFSWRKVLETSELFHRPECGDIWELPGLASLCAMDSHIVIHPGKTDKVVLDILSAEIARCYRCKVTMDQSHWPGRLDITLDLQDQFSCQTVIFGNYPKNTPDPARKEPIEWIVLEQNKDTLTLLSKYALDTRGYWNGDPYQAYADRGHNLIWEYSEIRQWLNNTFAAEAFSPEEYAAILNTAIITQPDMDAAEQLDKVFLLSEEAVMRLLPEASDRITQATPYAIGRGAWIEPETGNVCWWLLPHEEHFLKLLMYTGDAHYHSRNVAHRDCCIRPAIRVRRHSVREAEPNQTIRIIRDTRVHCPWKPEYEVQFDWYWICKTAGFVFSHGSSFVLDRDTTVYVWGKKICFLGDRERIIAALRKAVEKRYDCSVSITDDGNALTVEMTEIIRSRSVLNEQKKYYLTTFSAGNQTLRISVDIETANDSHYLLQSEDANKLWMYFFQTTGNFTLRDALKTYFDKHSHYEFAQLLESQDIPFEQFHY